MRLLEVNGIMQIYVGDRSQRMTVAFERHREAEEILEATPFAAKLRIHRILGGPRPGASLPRTRPGGPGETRWENIGTFKNSDLGPSKIMAFLNEAGCEAGLVTYGTVPGYTTIYVPFIQADGARKALRSSSLAESIRINY